MKKNHKFIIASAVTSLMFIVSCTKDFIAEDLSEKEITLMAPANNSKLGSNSLTFWWEELDGASNYRVQLVKPDFNTIQSIILDSTTTKTKYAVNNLQPGKYQWRVRGQNSSTNYTPYTTWSFSIDSTLNISSTVPTLNQPAGYVSYSNSLTQTFSWNSVYQAEYYTLEIRYTQNSALLTTVTNITSTQTSYTFNAEGSFEWRVQAANAIGSSKFSDYNFVVIDQTPPAVSTPLKPIHGSDTSGIFKLVWTYDTGAAKDSLEVNTDSTFASAGSFVKYLTTDTTYQFSGGIPGKKYYWRLKSGDKAGNWSSWGTGIGNKIFRFRIK